MSVGGIGGYAKETALKFGTLDIHDLFKQHGFEVPIRPGDLVVIIEP